MLLITFTYQIPYLFFVFVLAASAARRNKGVTVSTNDRASVYLELAEAYRATDAQVKNVNRKI